jgi:hypothetical protein
MAGTGLFAAFLCWLVVISALNPVASSQPALVASGGYLLLVAAALWIPVAVLWERTPEKRKRGLVGMLAMYALLALVLYVGLAATTLDIATYAFWGLPVPPWLEYLWLLTLGALVLGVAAIIAYKVPARHYGRTQG